MMYIDLFHVLVGVRDKCSSTKQQKKKQQVDSATTRLSTMSVFSTE